MPASSTWHFPNDIKKLHKQFRTLAQVQKGLQLLVGAVLPILEGVLINKITDSNNQAATYFLILLVVLVFLHISLLYCLLLFEVPLPEFLINFNDQAQQLEGSEKQLLEKNLLISTLSGFSIAVQLSLVGLEFISEQHNVKQEDVFDSILNPWINQRHTIFWFNSGEAMYNMIIYLNNKQENSLTKQYRRCDDRIKHISIKSGFNYGEGYIGTCFQTGKVVTYPNTESLTKINPLCQKREDEVYCKTFIAAPIYTDREVKGVFILTSNLANQFSEEPHRRFVLVLSSLLGLGIEQQSKKVG